jgi:hypothetical protein
MSENEAVERLAEKIFEVHYKGFTLAPPRPTFKSLFESYREAYRNVARWFLSKDAGTYLSGLDLGTMCSEAQVLAERGRCAAIVKRFFENMPGEPDATLRYVLREIEEGLRK